MKTTIHFIASLLLLFSTGMQAQGKRIPSKGMAKFAKDQPFKEYEFTRRPVGDNDILIDIQYASICHSDIHSVRAEWNPNQQFPIVPGHEIAGKVTKVGKNVTKFKVGDYAGIGCIVASCGTCESCKRGEEQFCTKGMTGTYGDHDKFHDNDLTQGGYSTNYVIDANYAIKIPKTADMKRVAPLLCAGITTYSPIQFSKVKSGDKVAVAGFGGLGHMAVKYAVAKGAKVTVFDVSADKRQPALQMGAVEFVNVNEPDAMKLHNDQFSFILSTIPANYDPVAYIRMLRQDGELAIVGLPANDQVPSISIGALGWLGRRKVYGSLIGGIPETQEMLDYSVANNIYPDVEIIGTDKLDEAYNNIVSGKARFRYVIDVSPLKK